MKCPVCRSSTIARARGPYHVCAVCDCWFQHPAPPKAYHGPDEPGVGTMPSDEIAANQALAGWLFDQALQRRPLPTLDIGAKVPVLASSLAALGCDAYAMDACVPVALPGVTWVAGDFEQGTAPAMRFGLVTLVHTFEHLYDPLTALRRLRALVRDDGRVFIRMPDHHVQGYERDLTPHHYTIHPFFHSITSILEALAQIRDCFVVEWAAALVPGQRDLLLRPIDRAPRLVAAMIVKNEERDLTRCLDSIADMVDAVALVDTGSTDSTLQVAAEYSRVPVHATTFLGASEQDDAGDWKLWDFSRARNESLQAARGLGADWIFWVDADDEVTTPAAIRRAMYWDQHDVYRTWVHSGGSKWVHHRLLRATCDARFVGRCHEYLTLQGLRQGEVTESVIVHHASAAAHQEGSNPRNLRMLLREWEEAPSSRIAFYLANTCKDAGDSRAAAEWYQKRVDMGVGYRDEWLFARLELARALRRIDRAAEADTVSLTSLQHAPDWAEFKMELSWGAYARGQHAAALALAASIDPTVPIPPTDLWREVGAYRDQPLRMVSWCYEHLGQLDLALAYARAAVTHIGPDDAEWNARIARLEDVLLGDTKVIALHRPGAIGDILMTLNLVPTILSENPDCEVWYFCDESIGRDDALGGVMYMAGVHKVLPASALERWAPRMHRIVNLVGYPLHEGYPERPMQKHLIEYFADELGVSAAAAKLTLPRPPRPSFAPTGAYATLQMQAGWSHYKEWPRARWLEVLAQLNFPVVVIDPADGHPLRDIIALVANATMHIGVDSFANHLTHYLWHDHTGTHAVTGVILWGSTQPTAAGYARNTNLVAGLPCQPCFRENPAISRMPRAACTVGSRCYGDGLHQCMQNISVDEVVSAIHAMWRKNTAAAKYRVFGTALAA